MKKKIFISIILTLLLVLSISNVYADQTPQCVGSTGGTTTAEEVKKFFTSKSPKNWYNFYLEIVNEGNKNEEGKYELTEDQSAIIQTLNTYIDFGNDTWFYQYYLSGGTKMEGLEDEQISKLKDTIGNMTMWVNYYTTVIELRDNVDEERQEGTYDDSIEYQGYGEFTKTKVKEILEGMSAIQWLELTKEIKTKVDNNTEEGKVKVAESTYNLLLNAAKCIKIPGNENNRTLFETYLTHGGTSKSQREKTIFPVLTVSYIEGNLEVGIATPGNKDDRNPTLGDIIGGADGFINKGTDKTIEDNELQSMSNLIYNILLVLGIIMAVVVGGFLGIKSMIGGLEGKAEVKEMLIPYVVGCVILFGAFTIWKIVLTILQ